MIAHQLAALLAEGRPPVESYDEHAYAGQRWLAWIHARDALAVWLTIEAPDTFDHIDFIDRTENPARPGEATVTPLFRPGKSHNSPTTNV